MLPLASAAQTTLHVPNGFRIEQIATVAGARELAAAPNGDLFVGTSGADVYLVPHADASGSSGQPHLFAHFDDQPAAGVFLGGNSLYVGTQFAIWKIPYHTGDSRARTAPMKLTAVRPSGIARDHVTTSVTFARSSLYASVGSSCDACQPDVDVTRATIGRIANGTYSVIARGVRNAIALTTNVNTGSVWAAVAGQDFLPSGHPYEIFDDVSAQHEPADYGWPYCYENHKRAPDAGNRSCSGVAVPRVVFPAYDTPIGAVFYPQHPRGRYAFPMQYAGGAFVTLHGSWHGPPFVAPRVAFVPMHGDTPASSPDWNDPGKQWTEFIGGFQSGGSSQRTGRPTGIAVGPQGDLFVADDASGAIYRIRPK